MAALSSDANAAAGGTLKDPVLKANLVAEANERASRYVAFNKVYNSHHGRRAKKRKKKREKQEQRRKERDGGDDDDDDDDDENDNNNNPNNNNNNNEHDDDDDDDSRGGGGGVEEGEISPAITAFIEKQLAHFPEDRRSIIHRKVVGEYLASKQALVTSSSPSPGESGGEQSSSNKLSLQKMKMQESLPLLDLIQKLTTETIAGSSKARGGHGNNGSLLTPYVSEASQQRMVHRLSRWHRSCLRLHEVVKAGLEKPSFRQWYWDEVCGGGGGATPFSGRGDNLRGNKYLWVSCQPTEITHTLARARNANTTLLNAREREKDLTVPFCAF